MQEVKRDLFSFLNDEDIDGICINTNGIVGVDGKAIMGAGTAKAAAFHFPETQEVLGTMLRYYGNKPFIIGYFDKNNKYHNPYKHSMFDINVKYFLFSFPTKNDFRKPAIPELIVNSAKEMVFIADRLSLQKIVLPGPGVGTATGKLNWEIDVKPIIKDILDDRFIITFLEK